MPIIEGAIGRAIPFAGTPVAGTSAIWTLTIDATGGTFKLKFEGETTADITWSATNNTLRDRVDAALEALSTVGTAGVTTAVGTMTAGVGTLTITLAGNLGKKAGQVLAVADNDLTGTGTLTVEETTPGVSATMRGFAKGGLLVDTDTGDLYSNTGTALSPTATKVGTQS